MMNSSLSLTIALALTVILCGCSTPPSVEVAAPSASAAPVEQYLLEDFEAPWGWSIDSCNNYGTVRYVTQSVTRGDRALELEFLAGNRGNTMFRCETDWDLGGASRVWLDVCNNPDTADVELAIAFRTKQGSFIEMTPLKLRPGWNRHLEFDIGEAGLKDKGVVEKWNSQKQHVTRVMLLATPVGMDSAKVIVDNLRVDRANANRRPRPTVAGTPTVPDSIPVRRATEFSLRFSRESLGIGVNHRPSLDVRAVLRSPGGTDLTVNAFLKAADDEGLTYAARFCPREEGVWQVALGYRTGGVWTNAVSRELQCVASPGRGMIGIDPRYRTHFAYETGERFYPIGQNVCWAEDYEPYLRALHEQGGNLIRVWICPWNNPLLEEKKLDSFKEESALEIDRLFELAGKYDIHVQLVLTYHGWLRDDWYRNPFNGDNGGPCSLAQEFWTKPEAQRAFKRYIERCVQRWSAYPELFAWELVNETDLTPRYNNGHIVDWHREMSDYLKSIDPHEHLVTTTLCSGNSIGALWDLPSIDFCSSHIYSADATLELLKELRLCEGVGKPYFVTEIGRGWRAADDQIDPTGRHLHHVLWLGWMTPTAGNCLPWWWDTFIEPNGLIEHFGPLAAFDKGEDRRKRELVGWMECLGQDNDDPVVELQGLAGRTCVYGFVYDRERMLDPGLPDTGPLVTRQRSLIVRGLVGGTYLAEYWDTYAGRPFARATLTCVNGRMSVPLPKSTRDYAFKVHRKEPAEVRVLGR